MARVLRGDVVWAYLDPTVGSEQAGRRPVVVLSHDVFNDRGATVIAVVLTSREPAFNFPLALELNVAGLPKRSWALISQIRTLSVKRLRRTIGRAEPEELDRIVDGLNEIVGGAA